MKKMRVSQRVGSAVALALVACTLGAGPVLAQSAPAAIARRGLMLGLNAGFGGSGLSYRDGSKSITEDPIGGALGAFRFGYSISPALALSLEGHGFGGLTDQEDDWSVGVGVLAVTWHPRGSGFFVRGGFGGGGGEIVLPDTDEKITLKNRMAGLFGVGYDWWLSENVSLGLAADGFAIDAGGLTGFDSDSIGAGGLTFQINWYL